MGLLNIGASCGLMAILAIRNLRCYAACDDHNPCMLIVGALLTKHFNILQDRRPAWVRNCAYSKSCWRGIDTVFSFAPHWTADGGIRNTLMQHFEMLLSFMLFGGLTLFDYHCNDVNGVSADASVA